jgi:glycosyltransferase involved in cell wall biosynthesis
MKKLILLTYTFPPLSTGGTPVVLNMCKYLPDNDWKVIVVTVANPTGMETDTTLLNEIPGDLKVVRVPHDRLSSVSTAASSRKQNSFGKFFSFIIHNYILVPDRVISWKKRVLPVLKQLIAEEKPHAIMSFGPHHSLHLIALAASRDSALPLIPFFGDLWLADSNVEWPSRLNRLVEYFLERKVVLKARGIIATTQESAGYFMDRYGDKCPDTHVAENAYDPERIKKAEGKTPDADHLTAGWTGNFFGLHSPEELLLGLEMFYERNPQSRLRFKMAGAIGAGYLKRLSRGALEGKVTHHGHISWADVPAFQRSCDVLVGYLSARKGSSFKNSSKTSEYLMSGRTILGIVPEGAMAERIRDIGRGYIVHPVADQIALALENMEYQWKTSQLRIPVDFAGIEKRFSAVNVMERMAGFLNRMAAP